jgi:uncharacterized protein YacL
MSVARLELVLRVVGGILAGAAVWIGARGLLPGLIPALSSWSYLFDPLAALLALLALVLAFALTPFLTTRPFLWLLHKVTSMPISDVLAAALGLAIGLSIGGLLVGPLSLLPFFGGFLPIVASLVLGYLGMITLVSHKRDVFQVLSLPLDWARGRSHNEPSAPADKDAGSRVLLDTSAIIDGRIADIAATGFVPGALAVPRFVLLELQGIADSADSMRRSRGRRGLEVLERLKRQPRARLEVLEEEQGAEDVDSGLVRLALDRRWSILTNDFNLNRVASIQGVDVLNVNELANAVKSVLLPGEEMVIRIIQEGKEYGQGIGYLEDGTMVVVENGRRHLNADVGCVVQRVLQTAAGRMVFANLRGSPNGHAQS